MQYKAALEGLREGLREGREIEVEVEGRSLVLLGGDSLLYGGARMGSSTSCHRPA
jgi:hypothetical protein